MNISIEDYIKNPTGGRAKMIGEAESARILYTEKFNQIMLKVNGKIDYYISKCHQKVKIKYFMM